MWLSTSMTLGDEMIKWAVQKQWSLLYIAADLQEIWKNRLAYNRNIWENQALYIHTGEIQIKNKKSQILNPENNTSGATEKQFTRINHMMYATMRNVHVPHLVLWTLASLEVTIFAICSQFPLTRGGRCSYKHEAENYNLQQGWAIAGRLDIIIKGKQAMANLGKL